METVSYSENRQGRRPRSWWQGRLCDFWWHSEGLFGISELSEPMCFWFRFVFPGAVSYSALTHTVLKFYNPGQLWCYIKVHWEDHWLILLGCSAVPC